MPDSGAAPSRGGAGGSVATEPTAPPRSSSSTGASASAIGRRWWNRPATPLVVLAVTAVLFAGFGLFQAWHDSPTFDEPPYIAAGLTSLTRHDLRINPEHPPLAKALAAVPVLFARPVIPDTPAYRRGDERVYSAEFVQTQLRSGDLQRVVFLARLIPLAEAIAAAFVLYALARRLFGRGAGVTAGLLWLGGPLVLGLGHIDGIDLPFTLATLIVSLTLVHVLELARIDPRTRRRLIGLGIACGVAAAVKDTGLILAAVAPALVAVSGWRSRRWRTLVDAILVGVVAWLVVWLVYAVIAPSSILHLGVLPRPDLDGLRYLSTNDTSPGPGYLLGWAWTGARWWYWPLSLVIKVPLVTLAVLVIGPFGLARVRRSIRWRTVAAVVVPAVVLTIPTVPVPRDIGVRYLLPVLALWLVAASAIVRLGRGAIVRGLLVAVLAIALVSTGLSNPHSIAWTAPPFRPGYRIASDSNVDWGQDFYRLVDWSQGRHPYVAYFGPRGLGPADVPGARALLATRPDRVLGWVAASATLLTSTNRAQLSWLRAYCPLSSLGGSILIYRFARPPSTAPGPIAPAAPCRSGAAFSSRPPAPG